MWRNLILVMTSLVVGALMIETICRFIIVLPSPYANSPELIVRDERGFWILKPGFTGVMDNRADFRGKALSAGPDGGRTVPCRKVSPQKRRVFAIGDSQTFGHGLSDAETWTNLLQCRLNEAGAGIQVFNFGVPGINTDSYVRRIEQIYGALRPGDRVLVGVTWNDLHTIQHDAAVESARRFVAGLAEQSKQVSFDARPARPIQQLHEATWRHRVFRSTGMFVPRFDDLKSFVDSMLFTSAAYALIYPRIKELFYRYRPSDSLYRKLPERVFENNFEVLSILQDAVRSTGARLDVVFLPNRLFFDSSYYRAYSQQGRVFPAQDFPGHLGKRFCPIAQLRCLSMFGYLKTKRRDAHTFAFDGHYNEAGARRIADGLFEELFSPTQ